MVNIERHYETPAGVVRALDGVSFEITQGERVILLGPSGSGKTTLIDILCGLYLPDRGAVYINNTPLNDYLMEDWRRNIGYVSQEDNLITGTIKENIVMNNPEATDVEIYEAAKIAGIDHYISNLPNNYMTLIRENGENFSGGQKKRVAIARAIINKPKIVVFDETTWNVENKIEKEIIAKLKRHTSDITIIVITHPLTNINIADKVIVLNDGKVLNLSQYSKIYNDNEVSLIKQINKRVCHVRNDLST